MVASGNAGEDAVQSWTEAQRRLWEAWSSPGQNVSQAADSGHGGGHCLDTLEALAEQALAVQRASWQTWASAMQAMPGFPDGYRSWLQQATDPMDWWSDTQQHLLRACFALGRQLVSCPDGANVWPTWWAQGTGHEGR
jgi:hypothetical protein